VQVDDTEQRIGAVLIDIGPTPYGAQVVPQRQMPRRLGPTEDPRNLSTS
jgi:hypothetical protein